MKQKTDFSQITIEIPQEKYRELENQAKTLGLCLNELVLNILETRQHCFRSDHYPNKETQNSLKNIEENKNLSEVKDLAMFSKILEM